ncbi:MAG: oxidoreductase [Eggerthellaceae bacterium]|nr:oxidoreductase [Eggerthellaceae bacterium]
MAKKAFLIDVSICNGCHNCQVACKDEHCGQSWTPYAAEQPQTGQFWCKVNETVHGTVPKVNITYQPVIGAQDEALAAFAPDVVNVREDGVMYIDPEKAKGRKDIAERFDGVFWNENLQIPQGCTGCAHLLDDGWDEPRCVDACPTEAMRFVDVDDAADELAKAERLTPTSNVYYLNLPKRWVAGQVVDPSSNEVVIGATCTLIKDGETVATIKTDEFGDFWFKQVDPAQYEVRIEMGGVSSTVKADATDKDVNLGAVDLS